MQQNPKSFSSVSSRAPMYGYSPKQSAAEGYTLADRQPSAPLLYVIDSLAQLPVSSHVLNLGCGDGVLEKLAGDKRPYGFVSFDIEASAIHKLNTTLRAYPQDDVAFVADMTKLDRLELPKNTPYTAAVSWRVLHGIHPQHYDTIMRQLYQWLEPGAHIYISVAADKDWKAKALGEQFSPSGVNDCSTVMFDAFGIHRTHPFPIHFFSQEELLELGQSNNFRPVSISEFHETSGFSHLKGYVSTYYFAEFVKDQ